MASSVGFSRMWIISFAIGLSSGFSFAYIFLTVLTWEKTDTFFGSLYNVSSSFRNGVTDRQNDLKEISARQSIEMFYKLETEFRQVEAEIGKKLAEEVRVLCWIMTAPEKHEARARHVKATWGPRCNVLLFMSTEEDATLPTVALNVTEGYDYLWGKTKEAFIYIYNNYLDSADWFLKADDDTYVIPENLRYLLQSHSPDEPVYFGCRVDDNYMSGGAGYVLSREAVKRFIEEGISDSKKCKPGANGTEDYELGICLSGVGVSKGVSIDSLGRQKFLVMSPETLLDPDRPFDIMTYFPTGRRNCCSTRAITFHYVEPKMMYVLDYLIYEFRTYGTINNVPDKDGAQLLNLTNSVSQSPLIEKSS